MAQLKSNPIIDALKRNEKVVGIKGYVGTSGDGQVELYPTLSPAVRFVIDSNDIIHAIEPDNDEEPASIYIRDSAKMTIVSTVEAKDFGRQRARVARAQRVPPGGAGGDACSRRADEEWEECLAVGYDVDFCSYYYLLIDAACRGLPLPSPPQGPTKR